MNDTITSAELNDGRPTIIPAAGPREGDTILELLARIAGSIASPANPSGESAVTSTAYTNSGTVGSGAWQIQCQNTGAADGVFAGAVVPAGKFAAPLTAPPGCLLPDVTYNATGTTLVITTISYF